MSFGSISFTFEEPLFRYRETTGERIFTFDTTSYMNLNGYYCLHSVVRIAQRHALDLDEHKK